jgi:hypothetical protein
MLIISFLVFPVVLPDSIIQVCFITFRGKNCVGTFIVAGFIFNAFISSCKLHDMHVMRREITHMQYMWWCKRGNQAQEEIRGKNFYRNSHIDFDILYKYSTSYRAPWCKRFLSLVFFKDKEVCAWILYTMSHKMSTLRK